MKIGNITFINDFHILENRYSKLYTFHLSIYKSLKTVLPLQGKCDIVYISHCRYEIEAKFRNCYLNETQQKSKVIKCNM